MTYFSFGADLSDRGPIPGFKRPPALEFDTLDKLRVLLLPD